MICSLDDGARSADVTCQQHRIKRASYLGSRRKGLRRGLIVQCLSGFFFRRLLEIINRTRFPSGSLALDSTFIAEFEYRSQQYLRLLLQSALFSMESSDISMYSHPLQIKLGTLPEAYPTRE